MVSRLDTLATAIRGVRARERLVHLLRRPFDSLPSRIILSVFAAALVPSLAVAWISAETITAFLSSEVDERIPAALVETSQRLESWYAQRELDIETFARSSTLLANVESASSSPGSDPAREEIRKYLAYVLEGFPQYQALFVLDTEGDVLLYVGHGYEPDDRLRSELARVEEPGLSDFAAVEGAPVQLASAPILDAASRRLGSLHAVVTLETLAELFTDTGLGAGGRISLVGPGGAYLLRGREIPERALYEHPLPPPGAPTEVETYALENGEYVVGSSAHYPRFGWTLVAEEPYDTTFAPLVMVIRRVIAIDLGIVAALSLIAFLFARSVVKPILALSEGARRIAAGETGVAIPETAVSGEIGVLIRVFNEMTRQLATQYDQLQRANEVLEQLSITDDLTRLHNHRFFQDALPREMRRATRTGDALSLVLIDIDDFKRLNDRFGHSVGDAVLRKAAEIMNALVRETDLLARYGGEEFALLAAHTDLEGAVAMAEKIRAAIARARFSVVDLEGPAEMTLTVSIGVATYRGDERALFNEADRALYRAKAAGKDCVVVADGAAS